VPGFSQVGFIESVEQQFTHLAIMMAA
jgi:hypothetical protein